jgi:hypothetical protein
MEDITPRDYFAAQIMSGVCGGDWKFEVPEGKNWDQMAATRVYQLADAMMKAREITNV